MRRPRTRVAAIAVAILAAASLAACSSSKSTPSSASSTGSAGTPVSGGTLRWVASGDVDHLDPMSAYYTATAILERGYTRQLVTYPVVERLQQGHHDRAGHGDRGADHGERRDQLGRPDLHVPPAPGRDVEHEPAARGGGG